MRVLLVEDNPGDALLLREAFRGMRGAALELEQVERLEQAIVRLRSGGVDVVLLDLGLPDSQGIDAVRRVYRAAPSVPIVVLTGQTDDALGQRAMQEGAQDYLVKGQADSSVTLRAMRYAIERKRAEESARALLEEQAAFAALTKERDLFARISETSPAGIVLVNRSGEITFANARAQEVLGLRPDEIGRRANDAPEWNITSHDGSPFPPEDLPFACVLRTRQPVHDVRYAITTKDRRRVLLTVNAAPLFDAAGEPEGMISCIDDVTCRVLAERDRAAMEAQLFRMRKMEALGRLTGGIVHDFNNMLSVILAYAALGLRSLPDGDPLSTSLEEIRRAGERSAELTHRLLAFSRQQVLKARIVDVSEVLGELRDMLRRVIGEDLELKIEVAPDLWTIRADPGQLSQVVMNLALNARDAMPSGGTLTIVAENVDVDEAYAREHLEASPGPHVMLAVIDSGVGMDKETQSHVFEPFFTTKERGKGTGLGLSTVFGIVRQSQGGIGFSSEPGKGTTFRLYFPRAEAGNEVTSEPATKAAARRTIDHGTETILLVEDEAQVRAVLRHVLEASGYVVLDAPGGAEALAIEARQTGKLDLLLTDVVMPGMNGSELAKRMRALRPGLRVVLMSGYTADVVTQHGVLEEGVSFLQKPIMPDTLLAKLRALLDERG